MKTTRTLIPLIACCLLPAAAAAAQDAPEPVAEQQPAGAVTPLRIGGRTLYQYRDEAGNLVVADRPPAGLARQPAAATPGDELAPVPAAPAPAATPPPLPAPEARPLRYVPWELAMAGAAAAGLGLMLRRRRPRDLGERLTQAGFDVLQDFYIPRPDRRQGLHVDYLARTPAGLLLVLCEGSSGTIHGRASDRRWIEQIRGEERSEIDNPLRRLQATLAAAQLIAGDVPVHDRVVFPDRASFAGGRPRGVMNVSSLRESLAAYREQRTPERERDGAWRLFMRHAGRDALRRARPRRAPQADDAGPGARPPGYTPGTA